MQLHRRRAAALCERQQRAGRGAPAHVPRPAAQCDAASRLHGASTAALLHACLAYRGMHCARLPAPLARAPGNAVRSVVCSACPPLCSAQPCICNKTTLQACLASSSKWRCLSRTSATYYGADRESCTWCAAAAVPMLCSCGLGARLRRAAAQPPLTRARGPASTPCWLSWLADVCVRADVCVCAGWDTAMRAPSTWITTPLAWSCGTAWVSTCPGCTLTRWVSLQDGGRAAAAVHAVLCAAPVHGTWHVHPASLQTTFTCLLCSRYHVRGAARV